MKRRDLIRHLESNGCILLREGKHAIYANGSRRAAVPRHTEIASLTAAHICDDLAIPLKRRRWSQATMRLPAFGSGRYASDRIRMLSWRCCAA